MEEIQYFGEHLLPGQAGRMVIVLAFFSAIASALFFLISTRKNLQSPGSWLKGGRIAFFAHSFFIIIASAVLLYILLNSYYEYKYVWVNTENNLELGFRIAAFWAGQEGSWLFWILCQVVIGLLLIRYAKTWEGPVMSIFALSQVFMTSMLLGWNIGGITIGMDPFILMRQDPSFAAEPLFQNPHYVSFIVDGNGLNPLLRNFWMLSHPPVLFIGFAAMLVPFAYALASLWTKRYHEWIKPSLPWTIFGIIFLGAGLMLGGIWAYEALTFGGFWAWDPVENASLVPWLILIAALHTKLVSLKAKHSYFLSYLFTILAFVFVVYSTFMTRSGVLADTSVHSFGDDGLGGHIAIYIGVFLILGLGLLFWRLPKLPKKEKEEVFTRDFWLIIGALVLVLSSFQIIATTSIPVYNKLFGLNIAPPIDVVTFYNTWQLPFGVAIALLIAATHFIKWGKNDKRKFFYSISLSVVMAIAGTILVFFFHRITVAGYLMLVFSSFFALFSSLDLLLRFFRQLASTGAVVTHLGVAMLLLAVVLTFGRKEVISKNTSGFDLGEGFPANENLLLVKDEILPMGEFYVSYRGMEEIGVRKVYQIDFLRRSEQGEFFKAFSAYPAVQLNERMGNVFEPYVNAFPLRDIFSYLTFAQLPVEGELPPEETSLGTVEISVGDTVACQHRQIIFRSLEAPGGLTDLQNFTLVAHFEVHTPALEPIKFTTRFVMQNGLKVSPNTELKDLDLRFRFAGLSDTPNTIQLDMVQVNPDFVIMKTTVFPLINLLWLSSIVLLVGLIIAFAHRMKKRKLPEV